MGRYPLTLFILAAAILVYLQVAGRQNAPPVPGKSKSDASKRPTLLIPGPMPKGRIYSQAEAVEWLRKRGVEANLFGSFTEGQLQEYLRDTRTLR